MDFKVEGPWNTEKYCRPPWSASMVPFLHFFLRKKFGHDPSGPPGVAGLEYETKNCLFLVLLVIVTAIIESQAQAFHTISLLVALITA